MSTILIFIAALLACSLLAVWRFRVKSRRGSLPWISAFQDAQTRKLLPEERSAVENYLDNLSQIQQVPGPTGASAAPISLTLNAESNSVVILTHSITRYGITTDDPNKWRYYLDSVEVHLPPFWEQYINDENNVELILTDTLPLVISLNGHTLQEYMQESRGYALQNKASTQASIRGEESEQIELLNIRQETHEEYALSRPAGLREALLIVTSFFLFFFCLITPDVFVPWMTGGAILLLAAGLWGLFAPPSKSALREIHCLRGTPRRWGLFGENNQEQINNISLGIIDLIYPAHWQPYITQDLGQQTDIDIYLDRHVARQGRFLSLHDEVKNFPLQHWLRSTVIAIGSLLVLFMLLFWIPLDMPIKFTLSWMKGAQTIEATTVKQLEEAGVRVGDTLHLSGKGMCNIHSGVTWSGQSNSPFMPFDCSQIIWNDAPALPLPESDLVNKAMALSQAVNRQLHPKPEDDSRVSASLRSAIQKSGMVLLDDFGDIVLKTADLCAAEDECVRLKNALVNLGNSKDWNALVKRANAGKLDGVNVLLRPVSAESLENLVTTSTAPFISRETARAAQSLNSPAPGGFLIVSDEGSELVDQAWPSTPLYDYPAQEQWSAFQRLAQTLMQTPFSAEGIVTSVYTDANGTQHIGLHRIPDKSGWWRYLGTTLLMLAMIVSAVYNGIQAFRRYQRHRTRMADIQEYYESCLNPRLTVSPENLI
ncbi:intracellular growth attenuator protein IgaA [Salmonella enterica]|uniref:IgaA: a membrane protein that prevents overactivation of the Rcs regulatory system n=1 Tax=Salmonella enterica subsp. salamae TaxID=59202 RepID=A0A6D2G5I6_SALER|nr:intracellular growth attenuator protein IgaA [Salmonella enterica]EAA5903149.1 intracellular growth attenuator protein IgaA [Salmonella enterica subsp. enterica]EDW0467710.1 intracellular growth attenuator protein IgaA [Salmonella enterica subsp. enterica serovar Victoria]ECJ2425532.1 intracellular growth attenuator protein IgaA [Salmonella enterica subsp. salamae]EEP8429469.1 intracellular growth attenuator protein IgaA [Salmonella enterica subsp. salamae]KAA8684716.1 intracellular growth 